MWTNLPKRTHHFNEIQHYMVIIFCFEKCMKRHIEKRHLQNVTRQNLLLLNKVHAISLKMSHNKV